MTSKVVLCVYVVISLALMGTPVELMIRETQENPANDL